MKPKICKPINSKTSGFVSCGKTRSIYKYGLCTQCFYNWLTEDERGKIYNEKSFSKKVKRVSEKNTKQRFNKIKEDITNWRVRLQSKVQEIARLIDNGLPCLARGTFGQIHGGHVFAKGGHSTMALNLHNIHRQSAYSNTYLNDDGLLREQLSLEYGNDYLEFVRNINKHKPLKHSNKDYKEKYDLACSIANELKKKDLKYNLEDRINLRNHVNSILDIYEKKYCKYEIILNSRV